MERTSCVFVSEKMEVLGMGKETAFTEAGVNYGNVSTTESDQGN